MGVVYKAEGLEPHRFVALKFLLDEISNNAQALARFERAGHAAPAPGLSGYVAPIAGKR
jgi:hypothetical protein